jgi:amino acid transporter
MSLKSIIFGREKSLSDKNLFHSISLIAVFAWVGLGADGLSSSCYGPAESYKALAGNTHLSLLVALACVLTIVAICASYSQIISLFPSGGGGYLVASKLLSPGFGVVSGCALLIDYVLTVTVSVASGADALFSLFPANVEQHMIAIGITTKLLFELLCVFGLTLINLRGVKESVLIWVPIFGVFVLTHAFVIIYALATHASGLSSIGSGAVHEVHGERLGRHLRDAGAAPAVLQPGRRHVHGDRGREQRPADPARAQGRDGPPHNALHGRLAGGHGRGPPDRLPALQRPA